MLRKLLLPALAATLLAGCVTGYTYRGQGASGDYYYGQPSVEYRYHGGYGYGYPGYGYGGYYGYPYRYGYPSRHGWYGYPYYSYPRYPYYRYPYRYDRHPDYRPGKPPRHDGGSRGNGPWTGVEDIRRRVEQRQSRPPSGGAMPRSSMPAPRQIRQAPRAGGESRPAPGRSSQPRPGTGKVRTQER